VLRKFLAALTGYLLSAPAAADVFPDGVITEPTPGHFSVCRGGGCRDAGTVALKPGQWDAVADLFQPPSADAAQERVRIAHAIALLERIVGPQTGTSADLGGTFQGLGRAGQMDCIDESVNTSTYLLLLDGAGYLRWHSVEDRVTRGFFLFGWPHTTAVIRERGSERRYVVDSWFGANGELPYIIPLKLWRRGWRPLP
jgi:hypothetical protein